MGSRAFCPIANSWAGIVHCELCIPAQHRHFGATELPLGTAERKPQARFSKM